MLPLKIAFRFLIASKVQTVLIIMGIAVGVSVQVFIGSLIEGLQADLIDSTIGNQPQITVRAEERGGLLEDDPDRFEALSTFDEEIETVNRALDASATLNAESSEQVRIRGFDFDEAEGIYGFSERLEAGRLPRDEGEVVLGSALLDNAGLEIGDTAGLFFPPPLNEDHDVEVVGVFDLGAGNVNETWVLSTLKSAKMFLGTDDISAYEMQLADVFASDAVALSMRQSFPDTEVEEWQSQNQDLLDGLEGQSISSLMIQVFVLISVVLGIASVLAITVLQKSRQLGILKAMGITDRRASFIFLSQGFLLGIIGAIAGVGLGLFLAFSFSNFVVDADGDPVVNIAIDPPFIFISATAAITASVIASIIPARRSARLSIIEVIRNG